MSNNGFVGQMLRLALPIALQNMLTSCAGLVDTAMVVGLGNAATAAVGVAGRWTFMLNLFLFGFCSGSSALISQYWGARDTDSIRRTFGLALSCAFGAAIVYNLALAFLAEPMMRVFTPETEVVSLAAVYLRTVCFNSVFLAFNMLAGAALRSTEDVVSPLLCSGVSVLANSVLNYVLIYGKLGLPAMGVQGLPWQRSFQRLWVQRCCLPGRFSKKPSSSRRCGNCWTSTRYLYASFLPSQRLLLETRRCGRSALTFM